MAAFGTVVQAALPEDLFARTVSDLDAIIALHESTPTEDISPASFTAGSFWKPLTSCAAPRDGSEADGLGASAIDDAARYLAHHSQALRALLCGAEIGGYEWWWQEHEPDEAPKG
jgi:hypothetical protein